MRVDDVPLVMPPDFVTQSLQLDPSHADRRLTFQNFTFQDAVAMYVSPHNSVARQSNGSNNWPPRFLFDICYGCAALKTWGVKEFVKFVEEETKEIYYTNDYNTEDVEHDERDVTVRAKQVGGRSQAQTPTAKAPDVMDLLVGLWMCNARKDMQRARMMEQQRVRDSVEKWLQSVVQGDTGNG